MQATGSGGMQGVLTLTAQDPYAFLVVRDRFRQEVGAGLKTVTFTGVPGVYSVEIRVPGRQSEELFVVEQAATRTEEIVAPLREPVVPPADVQIHEGPFSSADYIQAREEVEEIAAKQKRCRPRVEGNGTVILTVWSGTARQPAADQNLVDQFLSEAATAIQVRRVDGASILKPRMMKGAGFCILTFRVPAGTWQIESAVPGLGKRAQAVPVEVGWSTEVYLRVTQRGFHTATAVIAMFSHQRETVPIADRLQDAARTEVALDALSISRVAVTREEMTHLATGDVQEPIRAIAVGYVRLSRCCAQTDTLLFSRRRGESALAPRKKTQAQELLAIWSEPLQQTTVLGKQLTRLLPNNADARLLTMAALWARATLEHLAQGDDQKRAPSTLRDLLLTQQLQPESEGLQRRQEKFLYWLLGLCTLLSIAIVAWPFIGAFLISQSREPGKGMGLPSAELLSVWLVMVPLSLLILVAGQIYSLRSHARNSPLFAEPPVFSEGMALLLRLAALYNETCAANSRVTNIALRLTTDSIWTRWNNEVDSRQAYRRFAEAMTELEQMLRPAGDQANRPEKAPINLLRQKSSIKSLRYEAARHLAVSLHLPLSLILKRLRTADAALLRRIQETSSRTLRIFIAQRLAWALTTSENAVEFDHRRIRPSRLRAVILSLISILALSGGLMWRGGQEYFAGTGDGPFGSATPDVATSGGEARHAATSSGLSGQEISPEPTSAPGKYGGGLTDSLISDPKTFNRWLADDMSSIKAVDGLFESLIARNGYTTEFEPHLAEAVPRPTNGGRTFTFKLRPGLKWSDGQPITADDVVFTLDVIYDEKIQTPIREGMKLDEPDGKGGYKHTVFKYRKIDVRTIEIKFTVPYAPAYDILSFPIAPRHKLVAAYEAGQPGSTRFNSAWGVDVKPGELVSCGPWILKSYVPGQRLVYGRNPNYWKKDALGRPLPYLDSVVTRIVPDINAVMLKFRSGETDYVDTISHRDFPIFKRDETKGNYHVMNLGPSMSTNFVCFNMNPRSAVTKSSPHLMKVFRDQRFRQAVSHAINRQRIAREVYLGLASPLYGPETSANKLFYTSDITHYSHDVARARQLLADMGLRDGNGNGILEMDGKDVRFNILTNVENNERRATLSIITDDLRRVGLGATGTPISFNDLIQKMDARPQEGQPYPSYNWEAVLLSFTNGVDPHSGLSTWASRGNLHLWYPYQKKPDTLWEAKIDTLFRQGAQAMDEDRRWEIYAQWQQIAAKQQPLVYTVTPDVLAVVRNKFGNIKPSNISGMGWNTEEWYDLKSTRNAPVKAK